MKNLAFAAFLLLATALPAVAASSTADPSTPAEWLAFIFQGADPTATAIVKTHPQLAAEATKYLYSCKKYAVADAEGSCFPNQPDFVLDYIRAFYGDPGSQADLALVLSGSGPLILPGSYIQAGVRSDPVEGCAWGIVLGPSAGPPPMTPDIACAGLTAAMQADASARAKVLNAAVAAHLARGDKPPKGVPDF